MKINKLNYEAFMIDYIEGQLTLEDRQLMDQFLNENPEIKEEISMYLESPLMEEDQNVKYNHKEQHLRSTSALIRYLLIFFILAIGLLAIWFLTQPAAQVEDEINDTLKEKTPKLMVSSPSDDSDTKIDLDGLNSEHVTERTLLEPQEIQPEIVSIAKNVEVEQNTTRITRKRINKQKPINKKQSETSSVPTEPLSAPKLIMAEVTPQVTQREPLVSPSNLPLILAQSLQVESRTINLIEAMQLDLTDLVPVELIASEEGNNKRKKWWDLFIPQAYNDVDVSNVFVSATLQDSAEEMDNSIRPLQLITN